jgi:urease accessory protein
MSGESAAAAGGFARLLHLASSALPIGGYSYSQGLEWAVEEGLVGDSDSLRTWIASLLALQLARLDLPLLLRLHAAIVAADRAAVLRWNTELVAFRETAELRAEELARGRSLLRLLEGIGVDEARQWLADPQGRSLGFCMAFALAAAKWELPGRWACEAWAWSWLEAQVIAGVKLVPLGQVQGQRLLSDLREDIAATIATAVSLPDAEIGISAMGLALASTRHETQYTRLFRS